MNNRKEDPKLREVKDVLLRLQRMDVEENLAAAPESGTRATRRSFPWTKTIVIVCGIAAGSCVAAVIAALHLAKDERPSPSLGAAKPTQEIAAPKSTETGPEPTSPAPARVNLAQQFMLAGRLRAARKLLIEESGSRSEDVALALARSYDPNFLKHVPSADSEPDRGEAERWYREWHAIAKEKGLVTDGVALERLIRSMR